MNGELHVVSQTCTLKGLSTFFFATHPPGNLPEPLPPHLPSDEYEFAKLLFPQKSSKSHRMAWKFFSLYNIYAVWLVETHTFTARVIPTQLFIPIWAYTEGGIGENTTSPIRSTSDRPFRSARFPPTPTPFNVEMYCWKIVFRCSFAV